MLGQRRAPSPPTRWIPTWSPRRGRGATRASCKGGKPVCLSAPSSIGRPGGSAIVALLFIFFINLWTFPARQRSSQMIRGHRVGSTPPPPHPPPTESGIYTPYSFYGESDPALPPTLLPFVLRFLSLKQIACLPRCAFHKKRKAWFDSLVRKKPHIRLQQY